MTMIDSEWTNSTEVEFRVDGAVAHRGLTLHL